MDPRSVPFVQIPAGLGYSWQELVNYCDIETEVDWTPRGLMLELSQLPGAISSAMEE